MIQNNDITNLQEAIKKRTAQENRSTQRVIGLITVFNIHFLVHSFKVYAGKVMYRLHDLSHKDPTK